MLDMLNSLKSLKEVDRMERNEMVLVRNSRNEKWIPMVFLEWSGENSIMTDSLNGFNGFLRICPDRMCIATDKSRWKYCIPFRGNECLVQTSLPEDRDGETFLGWRMGEM